MKAVAFLLCLCSLLLVGSKSISTSVYSARQQTIAAASVKSSSVQVQLSKTTSSASDNFLFNEAIEDEDERGFSVEKAKLFTTCLFAVFFLVLLQLLRKQSYAVFNNPQRPSYLYLLHGVLRI